MTEKDIRELGGSLPKQVWLSAGDFGYHRDFTVKDYLEYMVTRLKDIPTRAITKKINYLLDILRSPMKRKKSQSVRRHEASCWYCAGYVERPGRYLSWTNRQQDDPGGACVCGISFPSFRMIESC